ncbi:MAG: trans-splicing intein-formed DNA polymerase III subunit alpha C-terminal partner DnaE-C [Cyanothece sp. SIO2G6]|nr:trans-splicing intein-formed DNA polymerase III subunit alpha C-terminal partner DnaE-C [Cyanothece sp. SIO2G6]
MVKILSRQSLGVQPVYDIGVVNDHNFLTLDGLIASNCFNKSHSMAYGYVTYQTAYLKANYPVEYMAALLSANSGDQEKVQMHIANCLGMGIEVLPPNVNASGLDFTPKDNTILFGLSAVRHVGEGAIAALIESREADGLFKSLADLCDRIDSRTLNKRAMEALIQSGAMDDFGVHRNQLMHDLPLVVDWAQSRAKDREIGQGNLFDMMMGGGSDSNGGDSNGGDSNGGDSNGGDSNGGFESAPKAPAVAEYPDQEKLKLEKELLGFYISDHPLKSVQRAAKLLAPVSMAKLAEQSEDMTLSAIVMISMLKPVITKKGDRMAILTIEDLTGSVDAVVFPRTYQRIEGDRSEENKLFQQDARLMVWGKVDRSREERVQFIVDDAEPIEAIQMVMVEIDPSIAGDIAQQQRLKTILLEHQDENRKGKIPVVAVIASQQRRQVVRLGSQFRVCDEAATVQALNAQGFPARSAALCTGG